MLKIPRTRQHQLKMKKIITHVAIISLLFQITTPLIVNTKVTEVFSQHAKIIYEVSPPFIHITFINTKDGYLALSFGDKMCPGDIVIVSYDRSPRIIDGFCRYNLRDTKPDYAYGGKNNWEILNHEREKGQGWKIETRRPLTTGDGGKLDKQFSRSQGLKWLSWAYHDSESNFRKFDPSDNGSTKVAQVRQQFDL